MLGANDVRDHLVSVGFMDGYTSWILHGEGMWSSMPNVFPLTHNQKKAIMGGDAVDQMLMEGFGMYDVSDLGAEEGDDEMGPGRQALLLSSIPSVPHATTTTPA
jgi:hypothetical protein